MPKTPSKQTFKQSFHSTRQKIWLKKSQRINPHRPFRRSYREDYARSLNIPGLLHHAFTTFRLIFRNWRLFLPLLVLIVLAYILLVGLMSEDTYTQFQETLDESSEKLSQGELSGLGRASLLLISTVTTGGLKQGMTEVQQVFAILLFIIVWLVTIYLLRHRLAGHHPTLRDGLYNALTPFISTLCVFVLIVIQTIPIMIVIITYSAAVNTDFLSTPFYALIYFIFAALLILLSVYLLSSSLIALVSVSAPGLYPMAAIHTASDLVMSRRTRFIIRIFFLILVLGFIWAVIMIPIILLDLWLKSSFEWLDGVPFVSLALLIMTCFTYIYVTAYLYLYYRRLLDYEE